MERNVLVWEHWRAKGHVRISGVVMFGKEYSCWESRGQEIIVINTGDVEGTG